MPNTLTKDQLLQEYERLQLRVSRFSATEQELINTRDQLDSELELYKRLQQYNSRALSDQSEEDFFALICEGIVDILELEGAIMAFQGSDGVIQLKTEGISKKIPQQSIIDGINILYPRLKPGTINHLYENDFQEVPFFEEVEEAIFCFLKDTNLNFEVGFVALNTKASSGIYNLIRERHRGVFSLFSNQMHQVLSNRKRSNEISKQLAHIEKSEQELKKLSLIATKSKNSVIITDKFGVIEWVNESFTETSGYTLEESIGHKPKDLLHGKSTTKESKDILSKALAKKEDVSLTVINYTKSGERYYNQLEIIPVVNEKGETTNFISIQKDTSKEKKHKQEMEQMNSRFELITNQAEIGIWEYNTEKDEIIFNDVAYDIFGLPKNIKREFFDHWDTLVVEHERKQLNEYFDELIAGKIDYFQREFDLVRASDKEIRHIDSLTVAERDSNGNLLRIIGSVQDITQLYRLQENLRGAISERDESIEKIDDLKSFYEGILEHSPTRTFVLSPDLELLYTNQSKEIARESLENLVATKKDGSIDTSSFGYRFLEGINQAVETKKLVKLENTITLKDGSATSTLYHILPNFANDELINIIVKGVDISELKNTQLSMLEKNEELKKINHELDNFVYSVSHDLRSPLLSIKGIVELLLRTEELTPKTSKFLNMALGSVEKLDGTIQEILEYSRNSRLEINKREFNIKELVEGIYEDLAYSGKENINFKIQIDGNEVVTNDKSRLNVILKNIIGNSAKYTREEVDSYISTTIKNTSDELIISIEDNGEGIAEEYVGQVFDMFFRGTRSSVGTGLGLYICKEIAQKLSGTIDLTSEKGQGTTVTIRVPN